MLLGPDLVGMECSIKDFISVVLSACDLVGSHLNEVLLDDEILIDVWIKFIGSQIFQISTLRQDEVVINAKDAIKLSPNDSVESMLLIKFVVVKN